MIADEYAETTWNKKTKSHYESFGYIFTRYGDKLFVKIEHLTRGSGVRIRAVCDNCGLARTLKYLEYADFCNRCATQRTHQDPEFKKKNSESMKLVNEVYKEKIRAVAKSRTGELHPNWNPNISQEERELKRSTVENVEWAKNVKKRDNYICQVCFKNSNNLISHHLMAFAQYPELRLDINNGITLCRKCHNEFHKIYGKGKNTLEQFNEYRSGKNEKRNSQ
jgi:5-methylcytosine-specific restriction endonuclease McrA